jgi:alpha-glucan,water dikinase
MEKSGLSLPPDWDAAWTCIKRVWASKWNERGYLSRRANGIPHEDLFMAVLIQKVVEADYGFVIHTVNPFTSAGDEIYAETVLGLGEALVGNYPGRALSFTCRKGQDLPHLLSFPSKSIGFFGSGLIFRSDSNGEDLAGYAGAGLYDSVMLPAPRKVPLDYTGDALVWNDNFRKEFMTTIAEIGTAVEKALGSPQDIEGAYSKGRYYVVQSRPQVGIEDV